MITLRTRSFTRTRTRTPSAIFARCTSYIYIYRRIHYPQLPARYPLYTYVDVASDREGGACVYVRVCTCAASLESEQIASRARMDQAAHQGERASALPPSRYTYPCATLPVRCALCLCGVSYREGRVQRHLSLYDTLCIQVIYLTGRVCVCASLGTGCGSGRADRQHQAAGEHRHQVHGVAAGPPGQAERRPAMRGLPVEYLLGLELTVCVFESLQHGMPLPSW
jgi:hypothetical protein